MLTFPVSKVEPGQPGKYPQAKLTDAFKALTGTTPEASAASAPNLLGTRTASSHGLINATHTAFADHYGLVLSPDDIWVTIAQGFAAHVNVNAEKLRSQFVQHEGKKDIILRRDSFVKGSPDNDWPGCFTEFSDKIAEYVGKKRDLLVSNFSTTTPLAKTVSEIVLMDTLQQYFSYGVMTMCGIPEITLLGNVSDWEQIRDRTRALSEFHGCRPWVNALVPVLDRFVDAFSGNADPKFWGSFYKEGGGSGGPYVTGAINVFFPYLIGYRSQKVDQPNERILTWQRGVGNMGGGPNPASFPKGISKVPFEWDYYGTKIPMLFLGGFVGASQDPKTLAVRPEMGWGIADAKELGMGRVDWAFEANVRARIAKPGPRCRHRCHGTSCEFPEGHSGYHITTDSGGFGWWDSRHSDEPTWWDRLVMGVSGP